METKNCQNCKKDFTIESEDFNFYEKIKVPPPTWCPECRQLRRYAWRNERTLYRRNCDLCGKSKVSVISPNKPYKVYCNECWWSDSLDSTSYGQDYDFSRPFFEQFEELMLKVPRQALLIKNSIGSDFTHHSSDNKNCYYSFSIVGAENVLYSTNIYDGMKDSCDCYHAMDGSNERHYECIDVSTSYQCQYSFFIKNCSNCYYCYDMRNCSNCFLSSNLRNKSFCILNEQYSREEYFEKLKEIDLGSYETREKLYKEFLGLLSKDAIHKFAFNQQAQGCTGNFVVNCKNAKNVFDANDLENGKNMYVALDVKDSAECYHIGFKTELAYEIHAIIRSYNSMFANLAYDNSNIQYCDSCHNSADLFGCVGIKKGKYIIFNKQYTKEEYNNLRDKIIEHMKSTGEYGEFFPSHLSPYGYNETQGQIYMPLGKKDAISKGFKWEESTPGVYGKETLEWKDVPDNINDVPDSFTKEALACVSCAKNFNIVPQELQFYKKENVPIPRLCPDCRYRRRINLRSSRNLWHRACVCDLVSHGHENKCSNEFETSYAPDRPEKVYCESCYNKEVY